MHYWLPQAIKYIRPLLEMALHYICI